VTTYVVRGADAARVTGWEGIVHRMDPMAVVLGSGAVRERLDRSVRDRTFATLMVGLFALASILVTALGLAKIFSPVAAYVGAAVESRASSAPIVVSSASHSFDFRVQKASEALREACEGLLTRLLELRLAGPQALGDLVSKGLRNLDPLGQAAGQPRELFLAMYVLSHLPRNANFSAALRKFSHPTHEDWPSRQNARGSGDDLSVLIVVPVVLSRPAMAAAPVGGAAELDVCPRRHVSLRDRERSPRCGPEAGALWQSSLRRPRQSGSGPPFSRRSSASRTSSASSPSGSG
jgi:hypothetical protein